MAQFMGIFGAVTVGGAYYSDLGLTALMDKTIGTRATKVKLGSTNRKSAKKSLTAGVGRVTAQ